MFNKIYIHIVINQKEFLKTLAEDDIGQGHLKRPSLSNARRFHFGLSMVSAVGRG
jgi:hypothetical protein